MTPTDIAALRTQLQAQKKALMARIAAERGDAVGRADAAADQFAGVQESRAQMATERDLAFALNEREITQLADIDAALARIDAGTFGECTDCGQAIDDARLRARPEAARCMPCQERAEQQHAQSAG